ncbi:MAG: radical SAM protein, partial [Deltaproteobacteria bacterium]|nr:radical SAM protein [Deltaproteobacteria bacterium]
GLYNAGLLEREGYEVAIIDSLYLEKNLNYRHLHGDVFHVGAELDSVREALKKEKPDFIIILLSMFSDVHKLGETYVKQVAEISDEIHPDAVKLCADCYVCGITYMAYDPVKLLEEIPCLDAVVVGEADYKLIETLRSYEEGREPEGIAQVAWRSKYGKGVSNPGNHPPVNDLDSLPYPAFHLLDMERYFSVIADAVRLDLVHEYHSPERFIPLMTSRGCSFSCNFCTQQVLAMPWRAHSVEYLKKMIRHFHSEYAVERFFFLDNNININPQRFVELIKFMAEEGMPWDAVNGYRADFLTDEAIELIKKAGNSKITVSAESGDPEVLQEIVGKRLDLKAIIKVAKKCKQADIPSQVHYIVGIPGETKKQINNTLEFAEMLYEYYGAWPLLQHAIPFRKTDLYKMCDAGGLFSDHPDSVEGFELEKRCLIRTSEFTSEEVMRFKANFRNLIEAMEKTVVIDLGSSCNNRCVHCEIADRLGKGGKDFEHYSALLKKRKERRAVDMVVTGGEPTLDREMLEKVTREAAELHYERRIVATNGRMFSYKGFALRMAAAGLNQALVSLNSFDPAAHDGITGVRGSFRQTVSGIRNLTGCGVKVDAAVWITASNLDGLAGTIAFIRRLGVSSIHLRYPAPVGSAANNALAILPYPSALPAVFDAMLSTKDFDVNLSGVPFCLVPDHLKPRVAPLPFFHFPIYRPQKSKPDECLECTEYISCLGFWRDTHEPLYRQAETKTAGVFKLAENR